MKSTVYFVVSLQFEVTNSDCIGHMIKSNYIGYCNYISYVMLSIHIFYHKNLEKYNHAQGHVAMEIR